MYSPKIREDLIPEIYWAAKALGIRMTTFVNRVLEKVLGEVNVSEAEEAVSKGNDLVFQRELEKALNGLQEEIKSSMVSQGRQATITGEFKISVSKTARLKCRFLNTDPGKVWIYPLPYGPKASKKGSTNRLNGGDCNERKEVTATGQELSLPEEDVGDFESIER